MTSSLNTAYLGPKVPLKLLREYRPYSENHAPAYIPKTLIEKLPFPNPKEECVEKYVERKKVTLELVEALKEDICNHVELRIHNFILQLFLVYKCGLIFSCLNTESQIGEVKTPLTKEGEYEAAHSSTFPALHITSASEGEKVISFAKSSFFANCWNATVYLPKEVNLIDSNLDLHPICAPKTNSLRARSIVLLNQTSKGELAPQSALSSFLDIFKNLIQYDYHYLRETASTELRRKILTFYYSVADSYQTQLGKGAPLLQKLFFRPPARGIDDFFYQETQRELHGYFNLEMCRLMPLKREIPLKLNHEQLRFINWKLQGILSHYINQTCQSGKTDLDMGPQANNYVALCSEDEGVKAAALEYFNSLTYLDANGYIASLEAFAYCFDDQFNHRKVLESALSLPAQLFCQALRKVIPKKAQKFHLIAYKTLWIANQNLLPVQKFLNEDTKKNIHTNMWAVITKANQKQTTTIQKHAAIAFANFSVKTAGHEWLYELAPLSAELQQVETQKMLKSTAQKPSENLSKPGLAFHAKTLAAIRANENNDNFIPKNFGYIVLCTLNLLLPKL